MSSIGERKKRIGIFVRRKEQQRVLEEQQVLKTGVQIMDKPVLTDTKKRYSILTNALINYLVTIGTMGCFMECFEIHYSRLAVMGAGLVFAFFMACLYLNTFIKLFGYILSFVGFMYGIIHLRYMIRGGFAYICNVFMKFLEKDFNLPIERSYDVYGYGEKLSVTMCLIFIVFAGMLLLNISITEAKNFEIVFLVTFPIVQIGLYFELPLNLWFFAMYMIGILTLFFLRNSNHCRMERKKKKGYLRRKRKEKVVFDYVTDGKYSLSFLAVVAVTVAFFTLVLGIFSPQKKFKMNTKYNEMKYNTRESVEQFVLVGFWGMFNPSGSAGGVGKNRMGQTKYVRLDYEDDLVATTFAEKGENHLYLKSFNGSIYRDAMWENLSEQKDRQTTLADYDLTASELERMTSTLNRYYGGEYLGTRKAIQILNLDATSAYNYLPYHTADNLQNLVRYVDDDQIVGGLPRNYLQILNYMPMKMIDDVDAFRESILQDNALAYEKAEENEKYHYRLEMLEREKRYSQYVHEVYLQVPQENRKTIQAFCEKYGLTEDSDHLVEKLAAIFEQDYEYTLMPGVTPSNKEFVNYFLEEQKKGYCVYFATASTLIFRSLGIPARYTGGYVLWNAYYYSGEPRELRENEELGDWVTVTEYSGEKYPYGLMEYTLDDSMAHAWVEIYIDGFGWIPVEMTPPSEEDPDREAENDNGGVFRYLVNNVFTAENIANVRDASIGFIVTVILLLLAGLIVYIIIGCFVRRRRKQAQSVVKLYEYLCLCTVFAGIRKETSMVYAEYGALLVKGELLSEDSMERLNRILEKDKFSGDRASDEEIHFVDETVNHVAEQIYEGLSWYGKIWYRYIRWL